MNYSINCHMDREKLTSLAHQENWSGQPAGMRQRLKKKKTHQDIHPLVRVLLDAERTLHDEAVPSQI